MYSLFCFFLYFCHTVISLIFYIFCLVVISYMFYIYCHVVIRAIYFPYHCIFLIFISHPLACSVTCTEDGWRIIRNMYTKFKKVMTLLKIISCLQWPLIQKFGKLANILNDCYSLLQNLLVLNPKIKPVASLVSTSTTKSNRKYWKRNLEKGCSVSGLLFIYSASQLKYIWHVYVVVQIFLV